MNKKPELLSQVHSVTERIPCKNKHTYRDRVEVGAVAGDNSGDGDDGEDGMA